MPRLAIDSGIARRVIDQRWPDDAGKLYFRPGEVERVVASNLELKAGGITHDERIVELYWELSACPA